MFPFQLYSTPLQTVALRQMKVVDIKNIIVNNLKYSIGFVFPLIVNTKWNNNKIYIIPYQIKSPSPQPNEICL